MPRVAKMKSIKHEVVRYLYFETHKTVSTCLSRPYLSQEPAPPTLTHVSIVILTYIYKEA